MRGGVRRLSQQARERVSHSVTLYYCVVARTLLLPPIHPPAATAEEDEEASVYMWTVCGVSSRRSGYEFGSKYSLTGCDTENPRS